MINNNRNTYDYYGKTELYTNYNNCQRLVIFIFQTVVFDNYLFLKIDKLIY